MLHIILGILTILLAILKWLGILLLILLLLAVAFVLIMLFVPVRYRGRGEKTAEKLGAELSVTWLLHLIVVEAAFDAGGGRLEIRIFGRTLEEWRALLNKVKRKKRKEGKTESSEARRKKQKSTAKDAKRTPEDPLVKTGKNRQNLGEKPETPKEEINRPEEAKRPGTAETLPDIEDSEDKTEGERKNSCTAEQIQKLPESLKKEVCEKDASVMTENKNLAETNLPERAGRLSKLLARIREALSDLPQKVLQVFSLLKRIAGEGVKAAQRIRDAVPRILKKIRRILHQPAVFLQFWEKYEVGEVLGTVKNELFTLLGHYRPRRLTGYLKFGTGDPAQTGELTGALYLLLPTQEYEIVPDFEEAQIETETELEGQIRSIHLLVTAYHLFRNKKLKRLIRKLRKKGE